MIRTILLFVICLVFALRSLGQAWQVYDMAIAGLPSNTVRAIAHESNGTTWLGTDWGLASFDGTSWTLYQMSNSPLPDNDIRALDVDVNDRLWIGTFNSGVTLKDGSSWTTYNTSNSGMPENQVKCVETDSLDVYICTIGGLAHYDGSIWRVYDDTPNTYNDLELPSGNIADVKVRDDGLVAIGTVNGGFTYLTDSLVTVYSTVTTGLPDNTALGVEIDQNGDRWAACPSGGLLYHSGAYDINLWFQYSTISSTIPSNALNDVVFDPYGRVCVSTQNAGIGIFDPPVTWINYTPANSDLPDIEVLTSAKAPNGVLWFGTASGGAASLDLVTGVENGNLGRLTVFPNPASDEVIVDCTSVRHAEVIRVFDLAGRKRLSVRSNELSPNILDIRMLEPGSYVLEVQGEAHLVRATLIVQR
jgi:ligand-binding sensor domain-containing protein